MAVQYVVSEAEMQSLFDQLRLESMRTEGYFRGEPDRPITLNDMHRSFHMVTVRWAQAMGYKGFRG